MKVKVMPTYKNNVHKLGLVTQPQFAVFSNIIKR